MIKRSSKKQLPEEKEQETATSEAVRIDSIVEEIGKKIGVYTHPAKIINDFQMAKMEPNNYPVIFRDKRLLGQTKTICGCIADNLIDSFKEEYECITSEDVNKNAAYWYITQKRTLIKRLITVDMNNFAQQRFYAARKNIADWISSNVSILDIKSEDAAEVMKIISGRFFYKAKDNMFGDSVPMFQSDYSYRPRRMRFQPIDYLDAIPGSLTPEDSDDTASIYLNTYTAIVIPSMVVSEYDTISDILMPVIYKYSSNPDRAYAEILDRIVTYSLMTITEEMKMYIMNYLANASMYSDMSYPEMKEWGLDGPGCVITDTDDCEF